MDQTTGEGAGDERVDVDQGPDREGARSPRRALPTVMLSISLLGMAGSLVGIHFSRSVGHAVFGLALLAANAFCAMGWAREVATRGGKG
jgi:hypothetical protein